MFRQNKEEDMSKFKIIKVFFLLLFITLSVKSQENIYKHVFKVEISPTMTNGKIVQTGFRQQGIPGIITALHGLIGGNKFSAINESGKSYINLEIVKVDVDRDLALLRNDELLKSDEGLLPNQDFILFSKGQLLSVYGYPQAIKGTYKRTDIKFGDPVIKVLDKLIPITSLGNALRNRGSPKKSIEVLNVVGPLTAGESGSPILDNNNQVLGVVNGGIPNTSINWAIPLQTINWKSPLLAKAALARLKPSDAHLLFGLTALTDPMQLFPGKSCRAFQAREEVFGLLEISKTTNWLSSKGKMLARSTSNYTRDYFLCTYKFSIPTRRIDLNFKGGHIFVVPDVFGLQDCKSCKLELMVFNGFLSESDLSSIDLTEKLKRRKSWIWDKKAPLGFSQIAPQNLNKIDLGFETNQISLGLVLIKDEYKEITMGIDNFSFQPAD